MGTSVYQQCSGFRCQVSATKFDPLCRSRSRKEISFSGVGIQLQPNQRSAQPLAAEATSLIENETS
jgi:hypothetical protein